MALETATYISDLVTTNPTSTDPKSQGDDHIRLVKAALKTTLPNITGAVSATHTELNYSSGVTSAIQTQLNTISAGITSSGSVPLWVSGTTYAVGSSVVSPINLLTYRRLVAGAGTTDPSNDTVNWKIYSAGVGSVNATVTASATLNTGNLYVPVQMASMGQSVTLPSATTVAVGGPCFIIDNTKGGYPCGIRDNAGTLIMAVASGGEAYVSLKDGSTSAGVWSVTGSNLEPGLITIDNTFSSTYSSTVLAQFVAMDNSKSIHFLRDTSSGIYAVAVDNTTGAVGTPVLVKVATTNLRSAFKVSATTAIAFYDDGSSNSRAVVISLSGATTLAVGTEASVATYGYWSDENYFGAPKIAQLTSTLYLASYVSGTNTSVVAVSVSGTTVTIGAPVNIITANSASNSTTTYALTATTALVLYKSGAAAPYANNAVVISVSGTTCTVWASTALTNVQSSGIGAAGSCLLSSTKAIVYDNNNTTTVSVSAVTITGTTVAAGSALTVESGITLSSSNIYIDSSSSRYNPHLFPLDSSRALLWYFDNTGVSRAVILSESGGVVAKGAILYGTLSVANNANNGSGIVQQQSVSEFLSIQQYGVASNWKFAVSPHSISGLSVANGFRAVLEGLFNYSSVTNIQSVKVSQGDYVFCQAGNASQHTSSIQFPIVRSNGAHINYRGSIKAPPLNGNNPFVGAVSPNRIVIIGSTLGIAGATTLQIRLLNLEIAA